jgi:hypothetical protein
MSIIVLMKYVDMLLKNLDQFNAPTDAGRNLREKIFTYLQVILKNSPDEPVIVTKNSVVKALSISY